MTASRQLSWTNFKSTVLVPGQQRVHRLAEHPDVEVFGDGTLNRIGLWVEVHGDSSIPAEIGRLEALSVRLTRRGEVPTLEVATHVVGLQRQFYYFACAVAEHISTDKMAPIDALVTELRCFAELLQQRSALSIERQVGLLGELIFLERLVDVGGLAAIDAWVGPLGEPHDFRAGKVEGEVKTTVATRRIHTIHGLEQLVPSLGCSLSIVSVLLGPPGAGQSLSLTEKIRSLSDRFAGHPGRLATFRDALTRCSVRDEDLGEYDRRFILRRPIGFVPLKSSVPAITSATIRDAFGSEETRIEALQYDLSVEGLEFEEGTEDFDKFLRRWRFSKEE